MHKSTMLFLIALTPAALVAQSASQAALSAEAQAKVDASISAARQRNLPERPIRDRVAEGQAKGATEAQLVLSAQRAEARMAAAQQAMVRAGRTPSDGEITRSEHAMARGATEVQIEAMARRTAPERSLEVALDVLTDLQARGVATEQAVASITSRLEARASDAALRELTASANVNAGANASVNAPRAGAAAGASATTGAAASAAGSTGAAATGAAAAAAGVVIKPPMC